MEEAGVDRSIITGLASLYRGDYRVGNTEAAEICYRHPDLFMYFAYLHPPLYGIDECLRHCDEAVKKMGHLGLKLQPVSDVHPTNSLEYVCHNMEKSLFLYQDVPGLDKAQDVIFEGEEIGKLLKLKVPKFRIVHLKVGDDFLELIEFIQPTGEDKVRLMAHDLGITHFCFRVENAAEFFLKIQASGYSFSSDTPVTTPTGRKLGYFRDPDGILAEILQEPQIG